MERTRVSKDGARGEMDEDTYGFIELLPDTNGLVVRAGHDELAGIADSQRPYLSVVSIEFLNVLELRG